MLLFVYRLRLVEDVLVVSAERDGLALGRLDRSGRGLALHADVDEAAVADGEEHRDLSGGSSHDQAVGALA